MKLHITIAAAMCLALSSCNKGTENPSPSQPFPNILLIIADDIGKDAMAGYAEGTIKPNTPHLDSMREAGLAFNNAWVYSTCSPTRSSIISGMHGHHTGVQWAGDQLDDSVQVLQHYINEQTGDAYATAVIGKWHLAGVVPNYDPETRGIDHYAGLLSGGVQDYNNWRRTEDGATQNESSYITEAFTNMAVDWLEVQEKPWFLWLAYTAPHTPFHAPPANMHQQGALVPYEDGMDPMPYYMAAIEAMDYQIGELLDAIPRSEWDETTIFFLGDNGTPAEVVQSPYTNNSAKGSVYQGGINTPFFACGRGVDRIGEDDNLICSTDLFATIAELSRVNIKQIHNSHSFASLLSIPGTVREYQYSDLNNGNKDQYVISNGSYKLLVNTNAGRQFFNLTTDPYETMPIDNADLTDAERTIKQLLEAKGDSIRQ